MKKTIYEKITAKYEKELFNSLREFVAIDSVYDEETKSRENPFGEGVTKALQYIENLARKDGFEVKNYANKIVEILCGNGEKNLTIMAHADVVPEGTGWAHDPFTVFEDKGVFYGRGVADDKGPLLASYYALKSLRNNKMLGDYQVRFLVGGNEESGSLGVQYYFETLKKKEPDLGFSPDSDFPLIFAEKGIVNFKVSKKIKLPNLISIEGGVASNSVIEKCVVKMEINHDFLDFILNNYKKSEALISTCDDVTSVTFFGKASHGALPELGVNAGIMALKALAKFYRNSEFTKFVKMYEPLDGSGYGLGGTSPDMGHNSSNVGLISYEDGKLNLTVNYRYVNTMKKDKIIEKINAVNAGDKVTILSEAPLLYFSKDSVLISTLLKAYQDETGDTKSEPLAIGGGTYAKETSNVVAYGMQFPGWESNMHSPGEAVKKSDLLKGMAVYARAIVDLGKKLENNEN